MAPIATTKFHPSTGWDSFVYTTDSTVSGFYFGLSRCCAYCVGCLGCVACRGGVRILGIYHMLVLVKSHVWAWGFRQGLYSGLMMESLHTHSYFSNKRLEGVERVAINL